MDSYRTSIFALVTLVDLYFTVTNVEEIKADFN